jgi:folate-binding protein YgfZ
MLPMTISSFLMQVRPERAVLALAGLETEHFLQSLVTADVTGMAEGEARYAGLLTPQGKILFDFFIVRAGDTYLLDCAASQIEPLEKRLKFYRLRAKITIAARPDLEVGVAPEKPEGILAYLDPRSSQIGWRLLADAGKLPKGTGYDAARIALGLADSDGDIGSSQLFPHEANFDQLGAVSFTKGCYVGQEVVSRMQHRSTARSRILPVQFEADVEGSEICSDAKIIGTVLSKAGKLALALVRIDRLDEATSPLLTDGVTTRVLRT